ncbi:MAG: hypothetical protein ACXVFN_16680 [Solirubrobacteraceae bacterium]
MRLDLDARRAAGELLATTFQVFRAHATVLFTMTLAVVAPVTIAIDGVWGRGLAGGTPPSPSAAATIAALGLQAVVIAPLLSALHMVCVLAIARGEEIHVGGAFRAAGPRFVPAIGAVALAAVGIGLGFALLVVPGIYLAIRWYVAAQAVVAERLGPVAAVRRSGELVRNRWWSTFGCLLLATIVIGLIALVGQALAAAIGGGALSISLLAITQAVAGSLGALFATLLYFDLRARQEQIPA